MLTQDYFTLEGDYRTFGSKDLRINVNWWIWGAGCSGNLNNAGTLKLKMSLIFLKVRGICS